MGFSVALFEQKTYPFHKVCGEYISNEVKPYLKSLGIDPAEVSAKEINRFEISAPSGKLAKTKMKMGGFGVSRYMFDAYLAKKAQENGVELHQDCKIIDLSFSKDEHQITTATNQQFTAQVVIGAYGKRNKLNETLERPSAKTRSAYVGIKHHFKSTAFPDDLVALHHFEQGYCGLSQVENGYVNLCYLTTNEIFKRHKSIAEIEAEVLCKNPHLAAFFAEATPVFDPLVISQINFGQHELVSKHALMCGDAAGLIHPLCGNGMAMAIHGAKLVSKAVEGFLHQHITREDMEYFYQRKWQRTFKSRMKFGQAAQRLFETNTFFEPAIAFGKTFPSALRQVVKYAHGKYF